MLRTKSSLLPALVLLVAGTAFPALSAQPEKFDADLLSPGVSPRAIVGFTHDVDASTVRRLSRAGIAKAVVLDSIDAAIVLGPVSAYRRLATWSDVAYVDSDSRIKMDNNGAKQDTKVSKVRAGAKPLKRSYTGKGVTVAVIDSGIDQTHPDFTGRIVKNVNFEFTWLVDNIQDGEYTDRFAEASGNGVDSMGHGTHVAGIIGGSGAGAVGGVDMSGVAPGASLLNLKITDAHEGLVYDLGFEANALMAYEWMIRNRKNAAFPGGVRVASNSWGVVEADDEIEPIVLIVKAAFDRGIVSVFAAGNSGPGPDTVGPGPARLEAAITVGAVCKVAEYEEASQCGPGGIASFSSRGKQVDVVAPGAGIWSALARPSALAPLSESPTPPPGTGDPAAAARNATMYARFSGTSMAAPHVSGIVALMIEANPKLTPAQVEEILIKTARDRGRKGFDPDYGFGLVDAHAAVFASIPQPAKKKR